MGKLDVKIMRYLNKEDFRVLTAIEMGMKNHEFVPEILVAQISNLRHGGLHKILKELCKHRLLSYETTKHYQGYRLTNKGYDYLALKTLTAREIIDSFGNQIGVGKESNIYVVSKKNEINYCLKLHRLGRICFRNIKAKRDYHEHRKYMSWLYLSRISAEKEFAFMKALYDRGFPIPKPIDCNRHCIIMELIDGVPLCNIREIDNIEKLYDNLMNIICRLAYYGVIHGDFNEFNIMLTSEEKPIVIDFPQMMTTDHEEAAHYFSRDVNCIREFFRRRFSYVSCLYPTFETVIKENNNDNKVPKILLKSQSISDDEDINEDVTKLQENLSKLEVEVDPLSVLSDTKNLTSEDIDENDKNEKNETINMFKISESQTQERQYNKSESSDLESTSTCMTEFQVKNKVKSELLKRQKKILNKKNLKKATMSSKRRKENRLTPKEYNTFWDN